MYIYIWNSRFPPDYHASLILPTVIIYLYSHNPDTRYLNFYSCGTFNFLTFVALCPQKSVTNNRNTLGGLGYKKDQRKFIKIYIGHFDILVVCKDQNRFFKIFILKKIWIYCTYAGTPRGKLERTFVPFRGDLVSSFTRFVLI